EIPDPGPTQARPRPDRGPTEARPRDGCARPSGPRWLDRLDAMSYERTMPPTMSGPKKRSKGHFTQTIADPGLTSTLAAKVRREVALEGGEPKKRTSRGHLTETVADPALTSTLAAKVRREVALES